MQVKMSEFLTNRKPIVKNLVSLLKENFEYVSILGTDVSGIYFSVRDKSTSALDSMWVERGFVSRVYSDGKYYEYSFNSLSDENVNEIAKAVINNTNEAKNLCKDSIIYPITDEEEITKSFNGEVSILLDQMSSKDIIDKLKDLNTMAHSLTDNLVDFSTVCTTNHVSKIFISDKKDLEQSYIWSEAYLVPFVRRDDITKMTFQSFSGLKGLEILDEMKSEVENVVKEACKLLDAKPIIPGEYDIICSPEAVGIIAHEAFGHGVEMDMFVKKRAKGEEYINKQVASSLVTMHDGSLSANHVSSYLFDDEGTLGTDTVVIDKGILKTGISDLLSAYKLGTAPTGNGKRESFENKAYTRMTNTIFKPGDSTLEELISSVSHGYFIQKAESGMEDPKDWGIQVMFSYATEIVDGKLTDNIVAPVIMTGYVPDLLCSISGISNDFELSGSGACGKGYKEYVKVSDGGPYIKAKARLG